MKKALFMLLIVAMVAAPVFAQIKVGLVTDVGGIDDKSFNQGTWEGVLRFAAENKLPKANYKYLQSSAEADYVPNLSTFSDEKLDLIVAPGFLFEKAMGEVAANYPKNKYLIIDSVVQKPNVASAVFAEHEGSFLVGVAAGLRAKVDGKKVVGFLGGMQFPLIERFQAGFEQGVQAVFPEYKSWKRGADMSLVADDGKFKILVDYAGDFGAPDKGQAIAQKQYNAGAYIIFHAAGGTGNGMIKDAKERSQKGDVRWAIGVDKDQFNDGIYVFKEVAKPDVAKSAVLTSMMKRVDVAAHDVAKMVLDGKFPGGQVLVFSLKNQGVGIPAANPNLSAAIVKTVKDYEAKIASGALAVSEVPAK